MAAETLLITGHERCAVCGRPATRAIAVQIGMTGGALVTTAAFVCDREGAPTAIVGAVETLPFSTAQPVDSGEKCPDGYLPH